MTKDLKELVLPPHLRTPIKGEESKTDYERGGMDKGLEIARNMKREGFDLTIIAKMTGVQLSEIENLD